MPSDRVRWFEALVVALLVFGVAVACWTPVADGDLFWHLAAGREMVRQHAWLRTDPFTLSASGRPWVDVHWLFQLGVYAVHCVAGLAGVVAVKAGMVAAGAVVFAAVMSRAGREALVVFVLALLAALFVARHLLLARPVIVTLVMLAAFFAVLEDAREGRGRGLLLLPALQIVWANCQGLAALGLAVVGAYWLGALASRAPARRLGLVLLACVAASFVTPYGAAAFALPARLLARLGPGAGNTFGVEVAENVAPFALERVAPEAIGHFKWYLAALGACLLLARRRLPLAHGLLLGGLGVLALLANRNVLLFYWMATPIAAMAVAPRLRALFAARPGARRAGLAGGAALVALELALALVAARREPAIAAPTPFHFPTESARRLAAAGATGPVFAPDHWGGYLTFDVAGLVPYIDTRLVLHTAAEYAAFLSAVAHPPEFDALAERMGFRYVLLPTGYPDRYLGLIQHLLQHQLIDGSPWRLVFTDGAETLFAREGGRVALGDAATVDGIAATLATRFGAQPALHDAARLSLARLLVVAGETRQARRVLAGSGSRAAAELRARAWLVEGTPAAAESLARVLLADDARDVRSLALLASIAARDGRTAEAAGWLRRALDVDPFDAEARALAATLAGPGAP